MIAHQPARGAAQTALAVTLAFALARILVCPFIGLGTNEAYAIAGGRLMSLSYFDHPPLHFWIAHLGEMMFGDTRWARLPFILLGAGTSWLMFVLTRRIYGEQAGVWATLALNLSLFFSLVSGNWILPDGPLNFFLLASAVVLAPLAEGRMLALSRWAAAGLLVGLAALSKYHALVFAGGVFLFLLTSAEGRATLRRPGPWLAMLIALAVFSPVLFWNAAHGWASLHFQGDRAQTHNFGAALFLSLLAAQFVLLSPWVVMPLFRGVTRRPAQDGTRLLLWLGLPTAIFFTLVPLWSDNGMVQWAMPGWLLLLPLAGNYLAEELAQRSWPVKWERLSLGLFALFFLLAAIEMNTAWLGSALPHLFRRGDPTAEYAEWTKLASVVHTQGGDKRSFVVTSGWRDASKIDQGLGGQYRVLVTGADPRNFAIGVRPSDFNGRDGWIVLRSHVAVANCFRDVQRVSTLTIGRGTGRPDADLTIWRGNDFQAERCPMRSFD